MICNSDLDLSQNFKSEISLNQNFELEIPLH